MRTTDDTGDTEAVLVDEGLQLLAAYRSISDRATRLAMKQIIVAFADADAIRSRREVSRPPFGG